MSWIARTAAVFVSWFVPAVLTSWTISAGIHGTAADIVAAVAAAIAIFLTFRFLRAGVDCTDDTVTVHNYLHSTTIPINAIIKADTRKSTVDWTDPEGRRHTTRVIPFARSRSVHVNTHSQQSLTRLRHWITTHQP